MKIKNLFFAAVVVLGAVVACKKEENVPAGITVDKPTLNVGTAGVTEQVTVTSSEAWTATVPAAAQSWLHIQPAQGNKGTTTVTVTVDPCQGKGRSARINFMASLFNAGISVKQEGTEADGDGSLEKPFSASEAYAWVMENLSDGASTPTSEKYYVKGIIHKINAKDGKTFSYSADGKGKATFFISDDGQESDVDFEAYNVYYLGNRLWREGDDDIKVGDEVIVYGQLKRYKTTAETGGSYDYLYSLNGSTQGKAARPDISQYPEKTIAEFIALADESNYYRLTGIVTGFQPAGNPIQGTVSDATGSVMLYGVDDQNDWKDVANDGTLVFAAKYKKYSKDGKDTHEAVDCIFGSFTPGESTAAKGDGSLENPFNATGAEKCVKDNSDQTTDTEYYVKGKIANIKNEYDEAHGTAIFSISDDGQMKSTFLCYSVKFLENQKWVEGNTQIKVGDEVIIKSKLTCYNGTYETLSEQGDDGYKGFIYSLNGVTKDTPSAVLKVASFTQTETGFAAEWTYSQNTADTEYAWSITEQGAAAALTSGTVKALNVEKDIELTPGTTYVFKVAVGDLEASAELYVRSSSTIVFSLPPDNKDEVKTNQYTGENMEYKVGSYSWLLTGFSNNNWGWSNPVVIACGRKADDQVASITTKAALAPAIKAVTVSFSAFKAANINSAKLYISSDSSFPEASTTVVTGDIQSAGDYDFVIAAPAENMFYKLEFDSKKDGSSNGFIKISEIVYDAD